MDSADLSRAYARPDLELHHRASVELAAEATRASSGPALLEVLTRWNARRESVATAGEIAGVRYRQDTREPAARDEHAFFAQAAPVLREIDTLYARTLTAHPARDAIDRAHGPQLLRLLGCTARAFVPAIRDALAEEAALVSQYTALTARAAIRFDGAVVNEGGLAKGFVAPERERRLAAHVARDRWLGEIGDELDGLYDRLVHLRHGMARALGHANYTTLGYQLLGRAEYGPAQVARFRAEVEREIVPIASAVFAARAKRLGVPRVLFHDEAVAEPGGTPVPRGDAAFCLEQARAAFDAMGPEPRDFLESLYARGMFDLANRDGKAAGAFCANFMTLGTPFVFANLAGTHTDVAVLMHECGHALQAYLSRAQPLLEYRFPTYEAAEVHSMSLEYLSWPSMPLFFGDEAARRYRTLHLEDRVLAMPYLVLIDHFQHEVYARPELTPRERRALFASLERRYLPWRSYGAAGTLPALEGGALWHRQLHVFVAPFYYVDYALAQACALQVWHRAERDRARTFEGYLAMCKVGGSVGFEPMVQLAGLRSPLEEGCLGEVARAVREALGV